ncbi:hypothetical protein FJU08_12295 [Martelella alba]|uniref:Thioesterase domain-containing protein n=1 Tax=Martelella alba TaxID=2590451 RepID=A0A506UBS1_9HYPH|nr:hypothetical protein [Martelella alba]TPW30099.1 hypothetical protein FJU08_12295 [Martelella alba]
MAKTVSGQIYLFRGLEFFSRGFFPLNKKLAAQGIDATVFTVADDKWLAREIARNYRASPDNRPIILVGHSLGANAVISVAEDLDALGIPVALTITLDTTDRNPLIPANVTRAVNFFTDGKVLWRKISPGPGFTGTLENIDVRTPEYGGQRSMNHIDMEDKPVIHDAIIALISKTLADYPR